MPASSSEDFARFKAVGSLVSKTVASLTAGSFFGCDGSPETKATWQSAHSAKPSSYSARHFGQYMLCLLLNDKAVRTGSTHPLRWITSGSCKLGRAGTQSRMRAAVSPQVFCYGVISQTTP